jgi:transcriptional regulator with GAF, ATPase, and Fis domain
MDAAEHSSKTSKACIWSPLDKVLATHKLAERPARKPDYGAEARALEEMSRVMEQSPKAVLDRLVALALSLCRADSAGVSILEETSEREQFRWHAIAGKFAHNVGSGMPRWSSPCGTVLDKNAALLFQRPEFHFPYQTLVDPPIVEALLVPFHTNARPVGTVWVIAHTAERQFDNEDVRLLTKLTKFASAAAEAMHR